MFAKSPLPEIEVIRSRLETIFPEGAPDRLYVVRETAARLVFVMLYVDAIEGRDVWLAPKQIYRMTDEQAAKQNDSDREKYRIDSMRAGFRLEGVPWYADNSREPIRDESLKEGLVSKGAVQVLGSVPTTSNKGRYALKEHFANLFLLSEAEFGEAAVAWQERYLAASELARIRILQERGHSNDAVRVTMPNGESRNLNPGRSSAITKAVIEGFSARFLEQPAVLWISESGSKVVLQDDNLMKRLNLPIDQQRLLPDLVLADLGREHVLLVFVEVVATDGPMTEGRKNELLKLTEAAGFQREQVAFLSAFEERASAPLKKRFSGIAVDSLVWCMSEPSLLIWLGESHDCPLTQIQ